MIRTLTKSEKLKKLYSDDFLSLFCEKNSNDTVHLRLKGKELYQRIGTRVMPEHMHKIVEFMKSKPKIISLDLSYNDLGDDGIKIFAEEYLNEENNLQDLNVMQCSIEAAGMQALSSSKFLKLKSCRLNGNKIGTSGARFIARLIENCPTLEDIDIAETDQTLESIESILIVIEHAPIKALNISRIIPNSYYTKYNKGTLADDLSVTLKQNMSIRELYIQKEEFDGHDTEILLDGLFVNTTLEMLDLGCNTIGSFGTELIADWLRTRPTLRGLDISANNIKDSGARGLSFGLPFSKIRYLDLSNNKISDTAMADVIDTLKKYCQMRILYIWGNEIGKRSCQRLSRMLKSGVLNQEYIDIKIYKVDEELRAAYYPANHYKHKYYCVMDHGCPIELKIKKNKIYDDRALPRKLVDFKHFDRYPPVDEKLGLAKNVCLDHSD